LREEVSLLRSKEAERAASEAVEHRWWQDEEARLQSDFSSQLAKAQARVEEVVIENAVLKESLESARNRWQLEADTRLRETKVAMETLEEENALLSKELSVLTQRCLQLEEGLLPVGADSLSKKKLYQEADDSAMDSEALSLKNAMLASELEGMRAQSQEYVHTNEALSQQNTLLKVQLEESRKNEVSLRTDRDKWEGLAQLGTIQTTVMTTGIQHMYAELAKLRQMWVTCRADALALSTTTKTTLQAIVAMMQERLRKQELSMSGALDRYKREVTERRKLYNTLQELRGNIRVYCRVRPILSTDPLKTNVISYDDECRLSVKDLDKSGRERCTDFEFDRVFLPQADQDEIFKDMEPLVGSVMDGYDVCIFAYGQTGSGKTYTMEGPGNNPGVNVRALKELFRLKEARQQDYIYDLSMTMIEIYNESVRDLLGKDAGTETEVDGNRLELRGGPSGATVVGATSVPIDTVEQVVALMAAGSRNRSIGGTASNERSSRSHSIVTVKVLGENRSAGVKSVAKLNLIDLAGSERAIKSEAVGERLKEASHINRSLSCLGDVMAALASKAAHVPYRNSKLTFFLQDSLGGHSKTLMFVNISPTLDNVSETLCSLNFASRIRSVETGPAKRHIELAGKENNATTAGVGTLLRPSTAMITKSKTPSPPPPPVSTTGIARPRSGSSSCYGESNIPRTRSGTA